MPIRHLKLEQVNAGTWKVVDPNIKADVPAKLGHWAGYRTTKALAWVVDLGYGQWMARCGNEVCNPTNLAAAKRQALEATTNSPIPSMSIKSCPHPLRIAMLQSSTWRRSATRH